MVFLIETLILIIILIFLLYKWSTRKFYLLKERGVPYEKPYPIIGNVEFDVLFAKTSFVSSAIAKYLKHKHHKVFGSYNFMEPVFEIFDIELIKKVCIKDFDHFVNHNRTETTDKDRILSKTLISLQDGQWKEMRNTLTPSFTGSKIRLMHEFVNECCLECIQYINDEINNSEKNEHEIEMKDFFSRFANDVIGTVAFGIKVNSLKHKENKFYKTGIALTQFRGWLLFKALLFNIMPKVMKFLRISLMDQAMLQYFRSLVFDAIKYRQEHNIIRPDMIHLLLEAKKIFEENGSNEIEGHATFDEDDLLAQCLIFFLAGFETISNCLCFTLYELIQNSDVQMQLYEEILNVEHNLNGKPLNYDTLNKMSYLDMVLSESLRKWPPVVLTDRLCNEDYTLTDDETELNVEIKKGEQIFIPIVGLHYDPEFFPEPKKFDPQRFSEANKKSIKTCSYLPFGIGPRNCIGNRLALMETKSMIYHMVKSFKITATEKMPLDLMESMKGFQMIPKEKFWMKFTPRSLHSLWTNSWCSFELKIAHNNKFQKNQSRQQILQKQFEQAQLQYEINYTGGAGLALSCPLQYVSKLKNENKGPCEILETKFIDSATSTENSMDDMVFQYNNQNSIYVLNSDYNSCEQNFPHFKIIESVEQRLTSTSNAAVNKSNTKFHSTDDSARLIQHKLKNFETVHFDGITAETNGNPITSLMSSATYSPATAAIQKLFNCNAISNTNSNKRTKDTQTKVEMDYAATFEAINIKNSNTNLNLRNNNQSTNSNNSNNMSANKLSAIIPAYCSTVNGTACSNSNGSGKKKCNSVKSTLIAKKSKFWKFLEEEEEKTRAQEFDISNGNFKTMKDCEECESARSAICCLAASKENFCAKSFLQTSKVEYNDEISSNYGDNSTSAQMKINEPQHQQHQSQQQFKVNNWSESLDSGHNQLQQQQQQQQKSSYELYKEAAELLGLSCTLCDNCRCLDCQSGYFDCDDSDSYSEFSTLEDYEYEYEEQTPVTPNEMALILHSSSERNYATTDNNTTETITCCGPTSASNVAIDVTNAKYKASKENSMEVACYCDNVSCGMVKHTNDLDDSDDKNDYNIKHFHARSSYSSKAHYGTSLKPEPEDSIVLETTKNYGSDFGALITATNNVHLEKSQQQQQQQEKQCQQHRRHHRQQHREQQPELVPEPEASNEVENCASFNGLSLLDAKTVDNKITASSCVQKRDCGNSSTTNVA